MPTITPEEQQKITDFLKDKHIPSGLGTTHEACSIAAINLALTGELKDSIPACMSPVIGKWIIGVQDAMTDEMRNSIEWRSLLPLAAGTGRDHEAQRSAILLDWMWDVVLPELQPIADKGGYGVKWKAMTTEKTAAAAADAAAAAAVAARWAAAGGADAAAAARWAAGGAVDAAAAAAAAARWAAAGGAAAAAAAARWAAAGGAAAAAAARKEFWGRVDPISVLRRLIEVSESGA